MFAYIMIVEKKLLQIHLDNQAVVNMNTDEFCLDCVSENAEFQTLLINKNSISNMIFSTLCKNGLKPMASLFNSGSAKKGLVHDFKLVDNHYHLTLAFS